MQLLTHSELREQLPVFVPGVVWDSKPGWARINIDEEDEDVEGGGVIPFTTRWLQVIHIGTKKNKTVETLDKGTQVYCLLTPHAKSGVVLGGLYSEADLVDDGVTATMWRKTFDDGTRITYDRETHELTVDVKGNVSVKAKNISQTAQEVASIEAPTIKVGGDSQAAVLGDELKSFVSGLIDVLNGLQILVSGAAGTVDPASQAELINLKTQLNNFLSNKVKVG